MINLSIVIPVYNEEENICSLLDEIYENCNSDFIHHFEIILVDDCSMDRTNKVLLSYIKNQKNKNIQYLLNSENYGQSFSINRGILNSQYEYILTIDGDGQNNPINIIDLVKILIQNKDLDLVGGIRKKRKDTLIKIYASIIANFVRRLILNDNCKDTGCSLKIFKKNIFLKFDYFDGIHRFLPALFSGLGGKTYYVDVDHRFRKFGKSKYNNISRMFKGISDLIRVYFIIKRYKQNKNV